MKTEPEGMAKEDKGQEWQEQEGSDQAEHCTEQSNQGKNAASDGCGAHALAGMEAAITVAGFLAAVLDVVANMFLPMFLPLSALPTRLLVIVLAQEGRHKPSKSESDNPRDRCKPDKGV